MKQLFKKMFIGLLGVMPITSAAADNEWISLGTAQYTDDYLTAISNVAVATWDVEVEESATTPGLYRLVDVLRPKNAGGSMPYGFPDALKYNGPAYMYIDATDPDAVYVTESLSGLQSGTRIYYFSSQVQYYVNAGFAELEWMKKYHPEYFGKMVDGNITFPKAETLGFRVGNNYTVANKSGKTAVKLPGAKDYTLKVESTHCADGNRVPVTIEAGDGIATLKMLFAPGFADVPMVNYEAYAKSYASNLVEVSRGTNYLNTPAVRRLTCLIFAYNEAGDLVDGRCIAIYGNDQDDNDWTTLGEIDYTDVIVSPMYSSINPSTYKVTLQVSKSIQGYYRLVNPYGNAFLDANNLTDKRECTHDHYIYVNATAPERVYLEESPIGLDLGYGPISVIGIAKYFLNYGKDADVIANSNLFGCMKDDRITLPEACILYCEPLYTKHEWLETDPKGEFVIDLTTLSSAGIEDISVDCDEADTEYYDLQGRKVINPSRGIYIHRQGSKTTKVTIP